LHYSRIFLGESNSKWGSKGPSSSSSTTTITTTRGSVTKSSKFSKIILHFFFGHVISLLQSHLQRGANVDA